MHHSRRALTGREQVYGVSEAGLLELWMHRQACKMMQVSLVQGVWKCTPVSHGDCKDARTRCLTIVKKLSLRQFGLSWDPRVVSDLSPLPRDGETFRKDPHLGSAWNALVSFKAFSSIDDASVSFHIKRTSPRAPWLTHLRLHSKCAHIFLGARLTISSHRILYLLWR